MKDLSTVTSSQSRRHWNGYQALSSRDHKTSRQTPETRESRSEHWLQTPKNQRKAATAAFKKKTMFISVKNSEDQNQGPNSAPKKLTWVIAHAESTPDNRVHLRNNCVLGWNAEKHIPYPRARRHMHKTRQCPTAAFKFSAGELSCMLNVNYRSKSTGLSATRGREAELSSVNHLWENILFPKIRPLKDGLSRNSIYPSREEKDLTCTAGTTWKIKLRRERGNRCWLQGYSDPSCRYTHKHELKPAVFLSGSFLPKSIL